MLKLYEKNPRQWLKAMVKFVGDRDLDAFVVKMGKMLHSMAIKSSGGVLKFSKLHYQRWAFQGGEDRDAAGVEWEAIVCGKLKSIKLANSAMEVNV